VLNKYSVVYGADPEGFFELNGQIVGSERFVPEDGLGFGPLLIRDGIQFELNPGSSASVRGLGFQIKLAFEELKHVLRQNPGLKLNWNGVVEVDREELDFLSEKSRVLGCQPSDNVYGTRPITVNVKEYRKRSAGGHQHFGLTNTNIFDGRGWDERYRLIPLFDIFVGNQCVLLDRDPGAAERRENYGRAGEHRKPRYGVEYRTLSNFWLRNYTLMSYVFGMSNIAISVLAETIGEGRDLEQELIDMVKINRFQDAINNNDWNQAMDNFETVVRPFLLKYLPTSGSLFPLNKGNIDKFVVLAKAVKVNGLKTYFPEDPVQHWTSGTFVEFHDFLRTI
jgi:hypothetical protein